MVDIYDDDFVQLEEDNPIFFDDQDELGPEFATIEEWQRHHLRNILELSLLVQRAPEKKQQSVQPSTTHHQPTNDESNGLTAGVPDPSLSYPHLASAAIAGSSSEEVKAADVDILDLAIPIEQHPTVELEEIPSEPEVKIEVIDYTKSPLVALEEDETDEANFIAMQELNNMHQLIQTMPLEAPKRKSSIKKNKLKHKRSISWSDTTGNRKLMEVYEVPYYLETRWHRFKRRHRLTMIIASGALVFSLLALILALYQFLH